MQELPDFLRKSEQRLLLKLHALDTSDRGCFARRETLAKMLNYSAHTINTNLARLKRRGFVTITTRGRGRSEAATVKLTSLGRRNASSLQTEAKHSHVIHDIGRHEKQQQESLKKQSDSKPVVTKSKIPKKESQNPMHAKLVNLLTQEGIDKKIASVIVPKTNKRRLMACIRYVKQSRGEKLNTPGMIVSSITGKWKLPSWAYDGLDPEPLERTEEAQIQDLKPKDNSTPKTTLTIPRSINEPELPVAQMRYDQKAQVNFPELTEFQRLEIARRNYLETNGQEWKAQLVGKTAKKETAKLCLSMLRNKLKTNRQKNPNGQVD